MEEKISGLSVSESTLRLSSLEDPFPYPRSISILYLELTRAGKELTVYIGKDIIATMHPENVTKTIRKQKDVTTAAILTLSLLDISLSLPIFKLNLWEMTLFSHLIKCPTLLKNDCNPIKKDTKV